MAGQDSSAPKISWPSVLILFAPLALLGDYLIARTHHRPLGAATFATLALGAWALSELFVRRVLDVELRDPGRVARRRARVIVLSLAALTAIAIVLRALL